MKAGQSCSACRYYQPPRVHPVTTAPLVPGRCRRYPVTEQKDPTDWCGEFRHKGA